MFAKLRIGEALGWHRVLLGYPEFRAVSAHVVPQDREDDQRAVEQAQRIDDVLGQRSDQQLFESTAGHVDDREGGAQRIKTKLLVARCK